MFSCVPEDDQGSSKHVKIMTNCVKNIILTFVGFCEFFMNAQT